MKKLLTLFLLCLSGIMAFGQSAAVQSASPSQAEQSFWTPQALWVLIVSIAVTGFVFLIMYALSGATIALSKEVEKKNS